MYDDHQVPADEHRDLPPSESTSVAEQTETAMPATTQDSQLMLVGGAYDSAHTYTHVYDVYLWTSHVTLDVASQ